MDDLEATVTAAVALGASEATEPSPEAYRVVLDPARHPLCLYAPSS